MAGPRDSHKTGLAICGCTRSTSKARVPETTARPHCLLGRSPGWPRVPFAGGFRRGLGCSVFHVREQMGVRAAPAVYVWRFTVSVTSSLAVQQHLQRSVVAGDPWP